MGNDERTDTTNYFSVKKVDTGQKIKKNLKYLLKLYLIEVHFYNNFIWRNKMRKNFEKDAPKKRGRPKKSSVEKVVQTKAGKQKSSDKKA